MNNYIGYLTIAAEFDEIVTNLINYLNSNYLYRNLTGLVDFKNKNKKQDCSY
jgi:hypothetical protein